MTAEFNIFGSALKGWVCPSKEGAIILRAYDRLLKMRKAGKLEYEAPEYGHWCRFISRKDGKIKFATYRDRIIERGEDSIAVVSLTFTK
jgi:hypothetical protein